MSDDASDVVHVQQKPTFFLCYFEWGQAKVPQLKAIEGSRTTNESQIEVWSLVELRV